MQFRQWLEEIEKIITVEVRPHNSPERIQKFPFPIYKNPTTHELLNTLTKDKEYSELAYAYSLGYTVRGFLTHQGDIFIWPSTIASHSDMSAMLNINDEHIPFYISPKLEVSTWKSDETLNTLKNNPNYKKMMGSQYTTPKKSNDYGSAWKDALRKKILPGTFTKLPYESFLIT
jgi:hypothetical protein